MFKELSEKVKNVGSDREFLDPRFWDFAGLNLSAMEIEGHRLSPPRIEDNVFMIFQMKGKPTPVTHLFLPETKSS